MVIALALLFAAQEQPPIVPIDRPGIDGRGRDPWVFRCIFEDRTRMVVIAPAKDWWMVFNPETCAMHKVWRGKIDFRGKVWDFSQENTRAKGRIYFASPSEIVRVPDGAALPSGWTAEGVSGQKDGWTFAAGGHLTSAPIAAGEWQRVFVAFDETNRKGRFTVSIWDDLLKLAPQTFGSATHVSSDTDWQWNFKRVERPTADMRVRVEAPAGVSKRLRNLRLYGDKPSWYGADGKALKVVWRGYDLVGQTKGVVLRYDVILASEEVVHVEHQPELGASTSDGEWVETVRLMGLPKGEVVNLRREGLSPAVKPLGSVAFVQDGWTFRGNGGHVLRFGEFSTPPPSPLPTTQSIRGEGELPLTPLPPLPAIHRGEGEFSTPPPSPLPATQGIRGEVELPLTPLPPLPAIHRGEGEFGVTPPPSPLPATQGIRGEGEPGLSVRVWDLDGKLDRYPTVAEGQRANYYRIHKTLDVKDGFEADDGPIRDTFCGTATGRLQVPETGRYRLRLTGDDGARLTLDKRVLLDTERAAGFVDEAGVELRKGEWPLEIAFYEDGGNFSLKLEWMPPGGTTFQVVPEANLLTEKGLTFVTGPGPKRWFYGKDPRAPGDGRPLAGVHPGYRLETIRPPGFAPAVGGMAFLPDGRLAICTWDQVGAVHLISRLNGPASGVRLSTFAEGLGEPLGVRVIGGEIWVTQKGEVTRLRDTDQDGKADSFDAMAGGWPASHNYHEFTFNLVPKGDKVYLSTSVPLRSGWTYYNPGTAQAYPIPDIPGSVLELDPKSGAWSVYAQGLRTPNGMGLGVDGELFVCDNQGSWLPCSKLIHVTKGGFYGHQLSPDGDHPVDPPALWLPHGEISNSPSEPVLVPKGRFKGQMLVGDVTYGGIQRCNLEKVDGVYQGAVFRFTQGIEAGVNRLVWGPDGNLYIGGIGSNGDWNHLNHRFGLQRLVPTSEDAFEILSVKATPTGFRVEFTHPCQIAPENLQMDSFTYHSKGTYGGPKVDLNRFAGTVRATGDPRVWLVDVPEMKPGYVYHFRFLNLKDRQRRPLWSTETWYTLNRVPRG